MSIEAMKQMVEALEAYQHNGSVQLFDEAITTGRQAIADAEKQEPVAWVERAAEWLLDLPNTRYDAPYFTNGMFKGDCLELADLLQKLTHPQPKREWVGLTEEDKQIAFDDTQEGGGFWEFADAIEAKLKEKNT